MNRKEKNILSLFIMLSFACMAQEDDFTIGKFKLSFYAGNYTPFVKTFFYAIDSKIPNGTSVPSPIANSKKKGQIAHTFKFGFTTGAELSWNFYKNFYAHLDFNYSKAYWRSYEICDSLLTYNGYWLDRIDVKARNENVFLCTGVEYRLHPFVFIHAGFLHDAYRGSKTIYITPELSEKSNREKRWMLDGFQGQYIELSTRIAACPKLCLSFRILHLNPKLRHPDKDDFWLTYGFRFFVF